MGRIRRGGYTFIWWTGDHAPRHVHVFDKNERLLTRVEIDTLRPMDADISPKILEMVRQLRDEGRL
jgi:hypothetical protein